MHCDSEGVTIPGGLDDDSIVLRNEIIKLARGRISLPNDSDQSEGLQILDFRAPVYAQQNRLRCSLVFD